MRLSIEKRLRIITLYEKYALHFKPKRFEKLTEYAAAEEIFISVRRVRDIVNKWEDTGSVQNIRSENAGVRHTKIMENDLIRVERTVYHNREITAPILKAKLRLEASERTVRRKNENLDISAASIRKCLRYLRSYAKKLIKYLTILYFWMNPQFNRISMPAEFGTNHFLTKHGLV